METPNVAAIAATVLPSGLLRSPDSRSATVARESPERMPSREAEISTSDRTWLSRSAREPMTTLVALATNVVKLFALTPVPDMASFDAVELHERIKWVQEDIGSKQDPASLQVLAEKAGVTRQVLQQWVAKSRNGRSPGRGETFTRCAKAWNVSLDWLQSGVGEPRPSAYTPLEQALGLEAWAPPAVAAAKAHYEAGARLGVPEWHRFLRSVHELTAASAERSKERIVPVQAIVRRSKREAG